MNLAERRRLLKRGVWLECFSIGYNIVEGVIAVLAGWLAGSVALVGFGLDSTIETTSAIIVLFRLLAEYRGQDKERLEATERRATRAVGVTLFALAGYILFQSARTLIRQEAPQESLVGIVLAALSLLLMPFLVIGKRRVGRAISSRALLADAQETLVCTYLSFTLLLGLVLNAWLGWWWADPVAALIMVPFIGREAREAWSGDACCGD